MKKNIVIGFHNPYLLIENQKLILRISKYCNIYLITTNRFLDGHKKNLLNEYKKQKIIKDYIIFFRYFSNSNNLNIFSIIINYLFIIKKLKYLFKKKIHLCILGSNSMMWERIITENIINKNCKLLIYQPDLLTLPITTIKEIYDNCSIDEIIKKVHKSRQLKINHPKNLFTKKINFTQIWNNKVDLFDRIVFGKFFFNKKFLYRELDKNTMMDTKKTKISFLLTYFETLRIYWKKIYPSIDVKLIKRENNCNCVSLHHKKNLLLLGDDFQITREIKKKMYSTLIRDIKIILSRFKKKILQVDFKPHPASHNLSNFEIFNLLKKNFLNIKINMLNKSALLEDIACNYLIVIGSFSTGLFKCKEACNYCLSVGMTSQSKYYYIENGEDGKDCWLKLKNTNIGYIDDNGSVSKKTFQLIKKKKKLGTLFSEVKKILEV